MYPRIPWELVANPRSTLSEPLEFNRQLESEKNIMFFPVRSRWAW